MSDPHLFSIVMVTYNRLPLLTEAVDALQRQTYKNLEIILVNNGSTDGTPEYLENVAKSDDRVKLVHFEENQYTWEDPNLPLSICANAGLDVATGDYVWYQSDDDMIADDYIGKMVDLFKENPECTTAAGIPVGINIHGEILDKKPRVSNFRPRHMPGVWMSLNVVRTGGCMFAGPGPIFAIKRDVLVAAGGYHSAIEISQLYGIVPFGITGFDDTAVLYWRRHEGQANVIMSSQGWIGFMNYKPALIRDWEIERRWQVYGKELAREVVDTVAKRAYASAADWFMIHLTRRHLRICARIAWKMWRYPHFWSTVVSQIGQLQWWVLPVWLFQRSGSAKT